MKTQIETMRETIGLTQIDLAKLLGYDSATICRWESDSPSGRQPPKLVLRVLEYLVEESVNKKTPTLRHFLHKKVSSK